MDILQTMGKLTVTAVLAVLLLTNVSSAKKEKELTIGEKFHKDTSLTWKGVIGDTFRSKPKKPPEFKLYPDAKKIQLPKPDYKGVPVEEAIKQRRSIRNYSKKPLTKAQLSQLLFSAQGVTDKIYDKALRTAPSAGALYPFEVYVVVNNVEEIPQGIYHYSVLDHALELVKAGDFRDKITDAGLKQEMLGEAGVTFILSSIFDRVRTKYGERGYRYAYMEAGHISQNLYLQSVSLGLGSVCAGAFLDEKVNQLIDVDGEKEAVIYLHAVGTL